MNVMNEKTERFPIEKEEKNIITKCQKLEVEYWKRKSSQDIFIVRMNIEKQRSMNMETIQIETKLKHR